MAQPGSDQGPPGDVPAGLPLSVLQASWCWLGSDTQQHLLRWHSLAKDGLTFKIKGSGPKDPLSASLSLEP